MKTDFIHVKSPQMGQIVRLASETVISSSLLAIKGPQGSGKTHAARMLARRWANQQEGEKDETKIFPWRVFVYYCHACSDAKTRLEKLIQVINPRQKVSGHRIPYLIEALASALRGAPSLLYLDNAHLLQTGERLSIMEAIQMARETHPVGMVMSTLEHEPAFEGILNDPRALAEIRLLPLKASEALYSMTHYDSRFEEWFVAYKDKDPAAKDLADELSNHINGSFARLVQLRDSLAYHVEADKLTLADVKKVIEIRTP
jgi:hypothetical protein